MTDVQVTFGANIEALKKGIEGVKQSVDSLHESATRLAEAFGVAFTIEGVKSFVESMAELGHVTENIGARLGLSNAAVVQMSGFAKMAGTDIGGFAHEIERASANLQKSTRDGINPAAQALKVMGLNAKDLVGQPADQWFLRISDAVSKFNPSLNLTNAVTVAFGRQVSNLLPVMLQGREKLHEFLEQWDKASEGIAAGVPGMAETHEKLLLMEQSATSLGARIFTVLKPAIDSAITSFTNWMQSIDSKTIVAAVQSVSNGIITIISAVGQFAISIMGIIDEMTGKMNTFSSKAMGAAGGVSAGLIGGALLGGPLGALAGGLGGGLAGWFGSAYLGADEAAAEGNRKLEDRTRQLQAIVARVKEVLTGMTGAIGTGGEGGAKGSKKNAGAIDMGLGEGAAAAMQAAQGQIKAADLSYQNEVEKIRTAAALHKLTEDEKTAATVAAINRREDAEIAAISDAEKVAGLSVAQTQKLEDQKTQIIMKAIKDRQQAQDQGLKADAAAWQSALKPIQSAWDSQLHSLLAGTETFGQAMKNIFADLVIVIIQKLETIAVEKLAVSLAGLFGDPAAILAGAIKGIQASMGQMYAGEAAFFAPTLGPGAPAAAASVVATTQATAMGMSAIGSFAIGGDVLKSGLGFIHAGEKIVPADVATPFDRGSMGGGATHVHNWNISALDGSSVQRWLSSGGARQIANALTGVQRKTPSMAW